jgi:drug/metabolite transporter (DMT)-like permease
MGRGEALRVHAALLFVQLTFGAFHVVGKFVLASLSPLQLASWRVLVAAPLLLVLARRVDRVTPPLQLMPALALLGFFGVFANQVLYVLGLRASGATNAAILMLSIPVFVTLAGSLLGIERPTLRTSGGVACAVVGALVVLNPGQLVLGGQAAVGNALLLGNCLAYALYLVLQRPLLTRVPPLTLVAWSFLFGGVGVVAVSLPELAGLQLAAVPRSAWLGLAYVVAIPTVVNYALNSWAMQRSSAGLVAAYTTLQPVVATVLAVLLLGERPGVAELAGFALIAAGLSLVSRSNPKGSGRERKAVP